MHRKYIFIVLFVSIFATGCGKKVGHPIWKDIYIPRDAKIYISGPEYAVSEPTKQFRERLYKVAKEAGKLDKLNQFRLLEVPDDVFNLFKHYLIASIELGFREDTETDVTVVKSLDEADYKVSLTAAFFHHVYTTDNRDKFIYWASPYGWSMLLEEYENRKADAREPRKACDMGLTITNLKTGEVYKTISYFRDRLPINSFKDWQYTMETYGKLFGFDIFKDINDRSAGRLGGE